ncbi:hypothetical protein PR048_007281 [Dryococelus australis]|uniref:Uncharacterized protein n=1 Tax=Dryococelus australis TaxID=614101 RepID=A0ABQ9ID50_9NEOP|nr:hypothetical protein PR048_007281 [Dryococelus australis]
MVEELIHKSEVTERQALELKTQNTDFHFFDEYRELLKNAQENKAVFCDFEPAVSRIDGFSHTHFSVRASVAQGFSVNRHLEVENLKEESYVAKRLIIEELRLKQSVDNLQKIADKLAEQTENINFIVQSNSFRNTAKEKLVELQKLEKKIQEISEKMKK